jgi:hypothetical protein
MSQSPGLAPANGGDNARPKVALVYIDSGGGHRASARALSEVMRRQQPSGPAGSDRLHPQVDRRTVPGSLQHHAASWVDAGNSAVDAAGAPHYPALPQGASQGIGGVLVGLQAGYRGCADPSLQSRAQRSIGSRPAWRALRDRPHRYCRLSSALLDRAAGPTPHWPGQQGGLVRE